MLAPKSQNMLTVAYGKIIMIMKINTNLRCDIWGSIGDTLVAQRTFLLASTPQEGVQVMLFLWHCYTVGYYACIHLWTRQKKKKLFWKKVWNVNRSDNIFHWLFSWNVHISSMCYEGLNSLFMLVTSLTGKILEKDFTFCWFESRTAAYISTST